MTTISAKTILRSRNLAAPDKVLSTLLLRYPRFIHAEFMTHRAFSRNAASSRAIPVPKMIDSILADTAMPIHWGANQRGMQADKECNAPCVVDDPWDNFPSWHGSREETWLAARDGSIAMAQAFDRAGYHKQVVNRLLEPFMHITVLVSATEWDNFLELRDHRDAEPHIQMLAREIKTCLENDSIQDLEPGEWHFPFVDKDDIETIRMRYMGSKASAWEERTKGAMKRLSTARCASTSYKTVDGFDMTLDKATELHDKLVASQPIHASPCEHVAQADDVFEPSSKFGGFVHPEEHGNFIGFRQYRHQLEV